MRPVDTALIEDPSKRLKKSTMGVRASGRWIWIPGQDAAVVTGKEIFATNLTAEHYRKGKLYDVCELGSGLVTNAGVNLLANDPLWIAATTPFCTFSTMNYVGVGTGATAAAATDAFLQTPTTSGSLTGSTNGYFTGVISNGGNGSTNVWKNVATVTYAGTVACTEWGLFMSNLAPVTGTATATSATSLTDTTTSPFATTGNKSIGFTCEAGSTAGINTPTTTAMMMITTGTSSSVITGSEGWVTLANAGASTPSGTTTFIVNPTMWDHKVFGAINVNSGDSIQFTYSLTMTSGG